MDTNCQSHYEQATERLFYRDSFIQEFKALVLACEEDKRGYRILLDRTAFFPESGGQFGDTGWLDDIEVLDTQEKGELIYHYTKKAIVVGCEVKGRLNFEERFSKMQQHTGEHILSGIAHELYGYENVGFHLGKDMTTMDFDGELTAGQLADLEERANRVVFQNIPVLASFPSKEELSQLPYRSKLDLEDNVRIVTIPGCDICACCAPHTRTTAEVGLIKILTYDKHRGGCRLSIVCGMRALMDYRSKQQRVTEVSIALSAKPDMIGQAVLQQKELAMKLREQLNRMQAVYLQGKLNDISKEDSFVCIFEEELDTVAARNFVNDAMEICSGICCSFVGSSEKGYRYIIGSKSVNMREFGKKLNAQFEGKGGGKPEMIQGSLCGSEEAIRSFLESCNVYI